MPLTRKLSDLYVLGKEITIDDGNGEPVTVYLRKITPIDSEEAYRAANAAKAKALSQKTDPDSLTFQIVMERCERMAKEELVDQLAELALDKKRPVVEAELEAEDRWSENDYLQGLHDAWESGLKEKHFTDPDEETKRVFDEMKSFDAELEKRIARETAAIKKDLNTLPVKKLRDQFFDEQFERQSDVAWVKEYRKQELFHAVRDPDDHDVRAFESPREVDSVANKLVEELRAAYADLSVPGDEGKG